MSEVSLGKWFGIPVYLHMSWVIWITLITFLSISTAMVMYGLFAIVLLHEFGHCFAARYFNRKVYDITLYPYGGVASIDIPERPFEEFVVVLCGPLVNVFLVLPLYYFNLPTFAKLNMLLLVFNLFLPAFPCDGGRIIRAVLQAITKNRILATTIATRIGQVTLICLGVTSFYFGQFILTFLSFALISQGQLELQYEIAKAAQINKDEDLENIENIQQRIGNVALDLRQS